MLSVVQNIQRGTFCPGFVPLDHSAFQRWLDETVGRFFGHHQEV